MILFWLSPATANDPKQIDGWTCDLSLPLTTAVVLQHQRTFTTINYLHVMHHSHLVQQSQEEVHTKSQHNNRKQSKKLGMISQDLLKTALEKRALK